jgi:hypothetical protein
MTIRNWKPFTVLPVVTFAVAACASEVGQQQAEAPVQTAEVTDHETPEGRPLSGTEIATMMIGTVHRGVTRGKAYTVRYADGGDVRFAFDDNSWSDQGTWTVENNKICVQWSQIRDGREGCWQIIEIADGRFLNRSDGSGGGSDSVAVRIDDNTYRIE